MRILDTTKKRGYRLRNKLVILPTDREALILGDLHGDFKTLCKILGKTNFLDKIEEGDGLLVCLGDYIDRGPQQIEVLHFLLISLVLHPDNIVLLRGNHEGPRDLRVRPHDFPAILQARYGEEWSSVYNSFREFFEKLYTAAVAEGKALLLHGGIPTEATSLDEIADAHLTHPEKPHLAEILWNDPSTLGGVSYSFRGTGKQFGADVASSFLDKIGVQMLIRGHECFHEGYHFHGDKVMTLFSCKLPVYQNKFAAYLQLPIRELHDRETIQKHIFKV